VGVNDGHTLLTSSLRVTLKVRFSRLDSVSFVQCQSAQAVPKHALCENVGRVAIRIIPGFKVILCVPHDQCEARHTIRFFVA